MFKVGSTFFFKECPKSSIGFGYTFFSFSLFALVKAPRFSALLFKKLNPVSSPGGSLSFLMVPYGFLGILLFLQFFGVPWGFLGFLGFLVLSEFLSFKGSFLKANYVYLSQLTLISIIGVCK